MWWVTSNIYWFHHTRSTFLFPVRETNSDTDLANPQPLNKQTLAEPLLFNMTFCALAFTDRVIRWPAVASRRHLPPRGPRCPSCPSYWPRWCVSWEPRRRSLRQTAPDPPGRAVPGWALREASGSHSSYLIEQRVGRMLNTTRDKVSRRKGQRSRKIAVSAVTCI